MSDAEFYKRFTTMLTEGKMKDIDTDRKEKAVAAKKDKGPQSAERDDAASDKSKKALEKKATNVKENAADFFRKYSDMIAEAEEVKESSDDEDEDPDVAIADKEKGKDKKTQKDADKNLPPWLKGKMDKADKSDEDKGAKKAKKDKDLVDESGPAWKK